MATLDQIRDAGEADLESLLRSLDDSHRQILRDAIRKYGRVQDVPESIWGEMQRNTEDQTAAAILLLLMTSDDWTAGEIASHGVGRTPLTPTALSAYSLDAARRSQAMAVQTIQTIRDRLARRIEDSRLTGPGATGDLTDQGIDQTLDDIFTDQRRKTIATDQATQSISRGQMGARDRAADDLDAAEEEAGGGNGEITTAGGDGAVAAVGGKVTIELIWRTERDNLVCPRCSPLEGMPEAVWGMVFPEGPGPDAHPNCRCSLEPQVTVTQPESE